MYKPVLRRRDALAAIAAICATGAWGQVAENYPNKPIRMVVGFATGGGTDVTARLFAQKIGLQMGQTVVVENRPGASGSIAAQEVARSEPDGYKLLMIASGTLFHSAVGGKVAYNIDRDFTPISMVTIGTLILMVGPSLAARTVPELIAYGRANPGKLTFATDGIGATGHLASEMFNLMASIKAVHVPFKGSGEATVAIASGQVDMGFPSLASAQPLLQSGRGRALAVSTLQRTPLMPNVPTLDESGLKGYELAAWFALVGPAGMPRPIVDKINMALAAVTKQSDVRESLARQGLDANLMTPEQLSAYFRQQSATVSKVAREAQIKVD